jgi:hypothetical protein
MSTNFWYLTCSDQGTKMGNSPSAQKREREWCAMGFPVDRDPRESKKPKTCEPARADDPTRSPSPTVTRAGDPRAATPPPPQTFVHESTQEYDACGSNAMRMPEGPRVVTPPPPQTFVLQSTPQYDACGSNAMRMPEGPRVVFAPVPESARGTSIEYTDNSD